MTARSNRPEVRNPMITLPEVQAMASLPPDARDVLRAALLAISTACRERGNEAWRKHKPPMAAYWKANAVNARHLARAIPCGSETARQTPLDPFWDEPFHGCAFIAFVEEAQKVGNWPESRAVKQRANQLYEEELARKNGPPEAE